MNCLDINVSLLVRTKKIENFKETLAPLVYQTGVELSVEAGIFSPDKLPQ